jgi:hypothetical protein
MPTPAKTKSTRSGKKMPPPAKEPRMPKSSGEQEVNRREDEASTPAPEMEPGSRSGRPSSTGP